MCAASSTVAVLGDTCDLGCENTRTTILVEGEGVSDLVTSTWGVGSSCNDFSGTIGVDCNNSSTRGGRGWDCSSVDGVEGSGRNQVAQGGDASRGTSSQLIAVQLKAVEAVTGEGTLPRHDAGNFD